MSIDVISDASAGLFAAACVLLAFAGAAKVRRPFATQPAAAALGLPTSRTSVRALGVAELGVAGAGLVLGGIAAAVVAVFYAGLTIAAWRLYTRSPETPCGCLGASNAPVSASHLVVNVAAAFAATVATTAGSPLAAVGEDAWLRVAFVVLVGCCASLVPPVVDTLPAVNAAIREGSPR